ncbi:AhpD-like protein [Aspergillus californicus]
MTNVDTNESRGDSLRKTCLVPYVDLDSTTPTIKEKLKVLPFRRNILLTLAHSHGLFPHFSGLLGACFDGKQRTIPVLDWQLIVLRIATILKAKYEFEVNQPVAEVFGFPQEKMDAVGCSIQDVLSGKGPWTDRDRVILRLIEEQLETYDNKPETVKDALKLLSVKELVEVLMMIGIYALLARVIKGLKVDDDPPIPDLKEKIKAAITD